MLQRRARTMEANLSHATGMLGASLTEAGSGKALSDRPALEPYRGKPAVRNLRGDDGNVGIIRSPIRAIVLPNQASGDEPRDGLVLKPPACTDAFLASALRHIPESICSV